jgi:magnesium-transporting ATPase (P-type)
MKKAHSISLMLLTSLLSFLTAISIFSFRYFTIGYVEEAKDLPTAGMQIWDIQNVFVVLIIATLLSMLIVFLLHKILKKSISNIGLCCLLLGMYVLAIVFFPRPFEFQVRHYDGPANTTYMILSGTSGDFIDGNENIFMGTRIKNETQQITKKLANGEIDYALPSDLYDCVVEKAYWFGHVSVVQSFFPILDKKNGDNLILQRCKPAKMIVQ